MLYSEGRRGQRAKVLTDLVLACCAPVAGNWLFLFSLIPVIVQSGRNLSPELDRLDSQLLSHTRFRTA